MAKSKGKSSGGGMNEMLLAHGEKIGLGVVGVLFLALVVFGFLGKPSIEESKSEKSLELALENKAGDRARQTYEPKPVPPTPPPTPAEANLIKPWVTPLFPLQGVRSEPTLLAAEQIRVRSGRAPFNVKGAGGGEPATAAAGADAPEGSMAKGEHYVIVTGLIPYGKQKQKYDEKFQDTLKMPDDEKLNQDSPEYYRLVVERAEVTPGVADDQLQWQPINEPDNSKVPEADREPTLSGKRAEWAETLPDFIPPQFLEPALVYGQPPAADMEDNDFWLPPRLPKKEQDQWSWQEVGHEEIKRAVDEFNAQGTAPEEGSVAPTAAAQPAAPPIDASDPDAAIRAFAARYPYRMFRFWDFTVLEGRSYKYRVTLVLRNPNRGYTKQYLKDEKLADGEFRPIDPLDAADTNRPVSMASDTVSVPGRSDIVVGGVVQAKTGANKEEEDAARIVATVWENTAAAIQTFEKSVSAITVRAKREDAQQDLETMKTVWEGVDFAEFSKEFLVYRGTWINKNDGATIRHPLKAGAPIETLKTIRFTTNFLMVDLRGGEPLGPKPTTRPRPGTPPPTFTAPGEYLLLDPKGQLVLRTEAGDRRAYQKKLEAEAEAAAEDAETEPGKSGLDL